MSRVSCLPSGVYLGRLECGITVAYILSTCCEPGSRYTSSGRGGHPKMLVVPNPKHLNPASAIVT